ncbi:hypothetical protein PanWU01x14_090890 [Parasponia andersonii]|uniref:Uncharacterized protein n=1 Tax=Parasponia andersonii TaxID=3476 RepID=A0A2P5D715_PARAD|nr:hypothetical protein PanWU01x14_090890 [Parasponia andersonii]
MRRKRGAGVKIALWGGNMVIRREGAFADGELYTDLPLGTARGAGEDEGADSGRVGRVGQVLERDAEGTDQGLGGLGGLGVEDLEGEERVVEGCGEREGEALVPDGPGRTGIVGLGGEAAVRVDPEDGVGLEVAAVLPVDVLEVLGGDDREVQIEELRRRSARRRHR